jgi:hypothetical protein
MCGWLAARPNLDTPVRAGDEKYFRLAMDVAQKFEPIRAEEEKTLMARAAGAEPIFRLGST